MNKLNTHSNLYFHHNFEFIAQSIKYYTEQGFEHIEVPWFIPRHINLLTKPSFLHHDKSFCLTENLFNQNEYELLGSAEQAFIYLALNNEIKENINYVAFSPCFRTEPLIDTNHLYYFLKVELFSYIKIDCISKLAHDQHLVEQSHQKMLMIHQHAFNFFNTLVANKTHNTLESVVMNDKSIDIELNQVEVGSYGNRIICTEKEFNNNIIVSYGTGLAEPRFSQNLK
jgi:hypothetical protein